MAIESVSITAGSTDPIAVDNVAGTAYQVNKISLAADGAAGSIWTGENRGGTIDVVSAITTGTIANSGTTTGVGTVAGVGVVGNINSGSIVVTAGTIGATSLTAGTLQTIGTVGTIQNINGGSIVVTAGTIAALTTGTIANSGTTTGVGTVAGVGVIGNINGGSIVVTAGTVVNNGGSVVAYGAGGTGVAAVGNPVIMAGVDGGGTVYRPLVDTSGRLQVVLNSGTAGTVTGVGTVTGAGTVGGVGTVSGVGVIGNINGGSIVVTAGTVTTNISNLGTVGTVQNINGGSIVVTSGTVGLINNAGTIQNILGGTLVNSGTTTGVGVVGNVNGGSIVVTNGTVNITNLGTEDFATGTAVDAQSFVGIAIPGASTHTLWDGKIVGGTVDLVSAITTGTIANSGTSTGVGVIGNVNGGSIVVTNGTIAAITTGTIANSGTTTGVGVVGNINGGSIVVTAGTIASSGTATGVGVVGNVNGGSIVVTNGTIASIATGTIASITNLAAGTVKLNYKPSRNIVGFNTVGTTGIGTLVTAPGVGTSTYLTALTMSVMSGTLDVCVGFGTAQSGTSVVERGVFIAGGGLVHDYPVAYSGSITNADLVYTIVSGAGTVSISGKYWTEAQ